MVIGLHPVMEAINSGQNFIKVFFKSGLKGELFQECFSLVRQNSIPFQYVPVEKLNGFTQANHQGVIALISAIPYHDISQVLPTLYESGKEPFLLVLDGITDIRNFGAIARSAEAAGVDAIVIGSKKAAMVNTDAIKTSSGALNRIPVCRVDNIDKTVQFLKDSGISVVGATEKAQASVFDTSFDGPVALVMGAEDTGLSEAVLREADTLIKIPMAGQIASLNVSVACGIILFDILRKKM
ncbi:MAG: 23S rRNA (guanosine(2251)-2'-O)-methyltransferase RlmB [Bacteroidales bacterium]|nr:23S rRNA (guanosine(2251)-2'-O)-methyltransferase RlmB [Bacteroidales bacterium]